MGTGPAVGDFPLSSHPGGSGRTLLDRGDVKFDKIQLLSIFDNICKYLPPPLYLSIVGKTLLVVQKRREI